MTILINIPFSGFYESIHDDAINSVIEMELENENINQDHYNSTHFDFTELRTHIAKTYLKSYCEAFESKFDKPLNLQFDSIKSPRFYNFETDKLVAQISKTDFINIVKNHLDRDEFQNTINAEYGARSGFIPYSSTVESLNEVAKESINESNLEDYAKFSIEIFEQLLNEESTLILSDYEHNVNEVISQNLPDELFN
jgi:hypothetical protein